MSETTTAITLADVQIESRRRTSIAFLEAKKKAGNSRCLQQYNRICEALGVLPNRSLTVALHSMKFSDLAWDFWGSAFLGEQDAKPFFEIVAMNRNLHELVVSNMGLSNRLFVALLEALRDHTDLKYLDLSFNFISAQAEPALTAFLQTHPKLQREHVKLDGTFVATEKMNLPVTHPPDLPQPPKDDSDDDDDEDEEKQKQAMATFGNIPTFGNNAGTTSTFGNQPFPNVSTFNMGNDVIYDAARDGPSHTPVWTTPAATGAFSFIFDTPAITRLVCDRKKHKPKVPPPRKPYERARAIATLLPYDETVLPVNTCFLARRHTAPTVADPANQGDPASQGLLVEHQHRQWDWAPQQLRRRTTYGPTFAFLQTPQVQCKPQSQCKTPRSPKASPKSPKPASARNSLCTPRRLWIDKEHIPLPETERIHVRSPRRYMFMVKPSR